MNEQDRQFLIEQLDASESELMAGLEGLSEADLTFRPAPGSWTILECLEHVVVVETLTLRGFTSRAVMREEPSVRREQFVRFQENGSVGEGKLEAPERVRPRGRYTSVEEGKAAFLTARRKMREYVAHTEDDLDSRVLTHPLFGEMTCHEWVLLLAGHARRHLKQIQEVQDLEHQTSAAAAAAARACV